MKQHPTLPTKREPVKKGIIKRLYAVTKNRKQRVAATAMAGDFDTELPGRKIGMALAVIVGVHVVAAGLVFYHHWRLEGRGGDAAASTKPLALASQANAPVPIIPKDGARHPVGSGETYPDIAKHLQVDENALREANLNTPLRTGLILNVPPKTIAPKESPEAAALRADTQPDTRGFDVEIPKATPVPGATLVKPNVPKNGTTAANFAAVSKGTSTPKATPVAKTTTAPKDKETAKKDSSSPKAASGRSYTVQDGDTLYRIAGRYKVTPEQLMKANGISDARKLKKGMTLSIPN
ncbi:MAG: LysM peptidoglycan-binding domain-containing protein [Luteolibacter sp.]